MEPAETIEYENGVVGKIYWDPDPLDPRKEWDHIGTMLCAHDRYDLGDEQIKDNYDAINYMFGSISRLPQCKHCGDIIYDSYGEWIHENETEEAESCVEKHGEPEPDLSDFCILPLYLYDHSGITMSTGPFDCPWDSGQVGIIYMHKTTAMASWSNEEIDWVNPVNWRELAEECLRSEVREYDQYITGDVYGYNIEDEDGEILDGCWGFFGSKHVEEEMKSVAESWVQAIQKEKDNISERLAAIERIGQ